MNQRQTKSGLFPLIWTLILFGPTSICSAEKLCFDEDKQDCLDIRGVKFDYTESARNFQKTSNKQLIPLDYPIFKKDPVNYPSVLQFDGIPVVKEFAGPSEQTANDAPIISFLGSDLANSGWDKIEQDYDDNTTKPEYHVRFRTANGVKFGHDCGDVSDGIKFEISSNYNFFKYSNPNTNEALWSINLNSNELLAGSLSEDYKNKQEQYICVCKLNQCRRASNGIDFLVEKDSGMSQGVMAIILIVLLMLSGLFSGLNLGLMSLDPNELDILIKSEDRQKKYAETILPVRKQGNFLLCTLLLGNTMVNSILAIFLESLFKGPSAVIFSTLGIVTFGEIIPQSICSRYGLEVGAHTIILTRMFMYLTFPLSWPISKILDFVLSNEQPTLITKGKLLEMLRSQMIQRFKNGDLQDTTDENEIDEKEGKIMAAVLNLDKTPVEEVMTPLVDCDMLCKETTVLDKETIEEILSKGHSRIPVYVDQKANVVNMLFVKDLARVNPNEKMTLAKFLDDILHQQTGRVIFYVGRDWKLDDVLENFQKNAFHLALVYDDGLETRKNYAEDSLQGMANMDHKEHFAVGIVTLEDVFEALIAEDIVDETDGPEEYKKVKKRNVTQLGDLNESAGLLQVSSNHGNLQMVNSSNTLSFLNSRDSRDVNEDKEKDYLPRQNSKD